MTDGDRAALNRLLGGEASRRATTDDLQGLLLQVVFALLMIFMIAYFIFVDQQKKQRVEEVMALNRQKLTLALEKVSEDHRVKYGLNALMTQGTDGQRAFEPDAHVQSGRIALAPAAKTAFAEGGKAAAADYAAPEELVADWRKAVFASAQLEESSVAAAEREWLAKALATEVENVRLDVRGVQRALAARLQRQWIEHPQTLPGYAEAEKSGDIAVFAAEIASALKTRSLELVAREIGAEVLP